MLEEWIKTEMPRISALASVTSQPGPSAPTSRLPPAITCKKSKKMCNHEVAFGKHYDKKLWSEYAKNVNSQKSTTQIDPTYNV